MRFGLRSLLLAAALAGAGCASFAPRRSWEGVSIGSAQRREPPVRTLPALDPAALEPELGPAEQPPRSAAYGEPRGGRRVADLSGPAQPLPPRLLSLPESLWRPALTAGVAEALLSGDLAPELAIDGVADADLDGDGEVELVVLARPASLFATEGPERYALLMALESTSTGYRLVSFARFSPRRHGRRWCHAEYRLAGFLRRGEEQVPLVWEEQGVDCGQLVGGGFDHLLHLAPLARQAAAIRSIAVVRARLGARGSADLYESTAWAADVDGDGAEELVVRGIAAAQRPCGHEEAPWWEEELAARVVDPAGVRAFRDGAVLPLPDGRLPAELTRRHRAACTR